MDSKTGLIIQFTGVFLITILSLFLRRSVKSVASSQWLIGWISLSASLFSLILAFYFPGGAELFFSIYFFAEYVFGLMLIFGCQSFDKNYKFNPILKLVIIPLAFFAGGWGYLGISFHSIFNFHFFFLASFVAFAFYTLKKSRVKTFGWRVMRIALALLAIGFYHYAIAFTLLEINPELLPTANYLVFAPIFNLISQIMLGFGMFIVILEQVLQDAKIANTELKAARAKLEELAHIDPLTTALNRHAFYGFLKKRDEKEGTVSGCVGFFDVDDLKPINDQLGHNVGDFAIRSVVVAIRDLIRAEDLIFRWGGDEFFVIMISMNSEMALERMSNLERKLTNMEIKGVKTPLTIGVSYGFHDFSDMSDLEQAIKNADQEMYRRKQARKLCRRTAPSPLFIPNENIAVSLNR